MEQTKDNKNKYIGNRYVPKHASVWDVNKDYESLTVVLWEGSSYTTRKNTPAGVDIHNDEYWALSANFNGQIENYRQDVRNLETDFNNLNDEVNEQLGQTNNKLNNLNDEVINARNGESTLSERLEKDKQEVTTQLAHEARPHTKAFKLITQVIENDDIVDGDIIKTVGWHKELDSEPVNLRVIEQDKMNDYQTKVSTPLSNGLFAFPIVSSVYSDVINDHLTVSQMMEVARSYFLHREEFVYDTEQPRTVFHPTDSTLSNLTGYTDKHSIVCSTFVDLVLSGISFENSRYNGGSNTKTYSYGMPELYDTVENYDGKNANQLALKSYSAGNLHRVNDNWSNIKKGDVLFFSKVAEETGADSRQFANIYHNGIYAGKNANGEHTMYHSARSTYAVSYDVINKNPLNVGSDLTFFSRYPLDETKNYWTNPIVLSKSTQLVSGTTTLEVRSGWVSISFNNVTIQDGYVGNASLAFIASNYIPDVTTSGVVVSESGTAYKAYVTTQGVVAVYKSADHPNNEVLSGTIYYPIKRVKL